MKVCNLYIHVIQNVRHGVAFMIKRNAQYIPGKFIKERKSTPTISYLC